jgi:hypothetical protein
LGTANFDSLVEHFAAIEGIERVEQQDRESFVVWSKSLSAQQLQSALWTSYENVARQACGHGNGSSKPTPLRGAT